MADERVVLVNEHGHALGTCEKQRAHVAPGAFHLAFSVFLYRADGATLLQRRALDKYHFPGVWTNACCSHPRPGEDVVAAAARRVEEELGLRCAPREVGVLTYRAADPVSGLVEHEYDHVLVADAVGEPDPDPAEVDAVCFVMPAALLSSTAGLELTPWCLPALGIAEQSRTTA